MGLRALAHRAIFLSLLLCLSQQAKSANLYLESGAGLSWLLGTSTPHYGAGFNGVIGATLNSANAPFQIHAAVALRYLSGRSNDGTHTQGYLIPLPLIRFEFPFFYIGAGATYGSFVSSGTNQLFPLNVTYDSSFIPVYGEVGLLWRTTPFFHMAATVSVTYGVGASGASFASPFAIDTAIQLRFLILGELAGSRESKARDQRARKMRGWRYPYGIAK